MRSGSSLHRTQHLAPISELLADLFEARFDACGTNSFVTRRAQEVIHVDPCPSGLGNTAEPADLAGA